MRITNIEMKQLKGYYKNDSLQRSVQCRNDNPTFHLESIKSVALM